MRKGGVGCFSEQVTAEPGPLWLSRAYKAGQKGLGENKAGFWCLPPHSHPTSFQHCPHLSDLHFFSPD